MTKTEEPATKDLMLHTILLQNNAIRNVPDVLSQIPSLKVIQLHGNPCAPVFEDLKNSLQNTSKSSEPSSETKSTKIIPTRRKSLSQTEPLLYQSMRKKPAS